MKLDHCTVTITFTFTCWHQLHLIIVVYKKLDVCQTVDNSLVRLQPWPNDEDLPNVLHGQIEKSLQHKLLAYASTEYPTAGSKKTSTTPILCKDSNADGFTSAFSGSVITHVPNISLYVISWLPHHKTMNDCKLDSTYILACTTTPRYNKHTHKIYNERSTSFLLYILTDNTMKIQCNWYCYIKEPSTRKTFCNSTAWKEHFITVRRTQIFKSCNSKQSTISEACQIPVWRKEELSNFKPIYPVIHSSTPHFNQCTIQMRHYYDGLPTVIVSTWSLLMYFC